MRYYKNIKRIEDMQIVTKLLKLLHRAGKACQGHYSLFSLSLSYKENDVLQAQQSGVAFETLHFLRHLQKV